MDAFDKLVAKHFPQLGPLQMLVEMVEKELDGFVPKKVLKEAKKDTDDVAVWLPVIKITEDWGKVSEEGIPTEDRKIIEMYTRSIVGNTVKEKLEYLNSIISGAREGAKLNEILGTMVILEVLSNILDEFTESAGGFIFEAFLAGLFGGQSVQIVDVKKGEGATEGEAGKPIVDVVLGDKEYSLKLLGPKTVVKGSFKNMVLHFEKALEAGKPLEIIYLDARREKGGLTFSEFAIHLEQFMEVFGKPLEKRKRIKPKGEEELQQTYYETIENLQYAIANHLEEGEEIIYLEALGPGVWDDAGTPAWPFPGMKPAPAKRRTSGGRPHPGGRFEVFKGEGGS